MYLQKCEHLSMNISLLFDVAKQLLVMYYCSLQARKFAVDFSNYSLLLLNIVTV